MADSELNQTIDLLRRARAGDESALHRVLELHESALLSRIRLMMGPSARRIAESGDFLNGVFVDVLEHVDSFEPRETGSFLRWATRIARNRIHDSLRKKRELALSKLAMTTISGLGGEAETPVDLVVEREAVELLVEALESLPEDRRAVIELRDFEALPFVEIATKLGRSQNAVQLLHTRAVVQLGKAVRRLRGESGSGPALESSS